MAPADLSANTDQDSIATSQSDCKEYDAFISYNSADEEFANDLVKHLESQVIGLKCVNHKRDFHPGRTIVGNIDEFLENSSKYVLIMSPDFVRSDWCQWETEIMVSMSVEEKRCIIPVLLKPCKIPKTLSTLTYVDVCHSDKWRERLVNSIKRTDIRPSFDTLSGMARLDLGEDIGRPDMKFDEETVHICRAILHDGSLLNREPSGPVTNSDKRLKKFFGAVATPALTAGGVYYWESKVDVDLKEELSSRNFLFAVALSTNGVFDERQVGHRLPTVVSVAARACERHEAVCLYVYKYRCLVYHEILTLNQSGNWLPIELGFLLDTIRQRLTIYDVTEKGEITCVDEIGDVKEFTPQFGVYAGHAGSVRLSLTRGQNTSLSMGKQ